MVVSPSGILPAWSYLGAGADVIIYPGQSNTVGYGIGSYTDSDPSNDSRIFQVGRFFGTNMTIIPMANPSNTLNPLHFWEYNEGRGYGVTFARLYAARFPSRPVIIVPAAHGQTSVLQWDGEWPPGGPPLYADMAARIRLALSIPGSRIVGWIENQGETDANLALNTADPDHYLMPDAATYLANKLTYLDQARSDFGTFPIVLGGFSHEWMGSNATRLAFQAAVQQATTLRDLCAFTDTTGVQSNYDADPTQWSGHFSAAGQEDLAQRHFETFCSLL